jgi:beta-glucosidase
MPVINNSDLRYRFFNFAGQPFRDLNKNGRLDIYEDPRQPIEARVEDLLRQMTLEEKAGLLFINGAVVNEDARSKKTGRRGFGAAAATRSPGSR